MKNYCASIKDITSGLYLISVANSDIELGVEEDRLLFYDEAEAENVLDMCNDVYKACFILLLEAK